MYYVYLLKSNKDGTLYTGQSSDLTMRIMCHSQGKVKSTKYRRPLRLIFYEAFVAKKDALRRERYLKTSKGKSSLKQILRNSLE